MFIDATNLQEESKIEFGDLGGR